MSFIDRIPMQSVIVATIFLGLLPFVPEPHLWQKLKMLISGELTQLVDVGDMIFHFSPSLLLIIKLVRNRRAG